MTDSLNAVEMFVIYENPIDFPNSIVVRKHAIVVSKVKASAPLLVGQDIEHIRDVLRRMGAVNIGRFPGDDPVVKEVWI